MEARSINYLKNIFWGIFCRIITILFPFAVRTVIIAKLGVDYLGLNTLFLTILQVLSLAELGFGSAFVCSMYEPIAKKDNKKLCAILNLYKKIYKIIGLIIFFIGVLLLPFIRNLIHGDIPADINIYILYFIYLINTVSSYILYAYRSSLLVANQRNDILNKINIFINLVLYILQIIVLILCANYYIYAILIPVFTIVNNLIVYKYSKKIYPHVDCVGEIDELEKKKLKKQVKSLIWQKMGNTIIFSFDSLVISYFLGVTYLGKYSNYYYVFNSIASFFSTFYEAITPGIGNSIVVESNEKNYNDFVDFNVINYILIAICSSFLICLYQPFMFLWQGKSLMLDDRIPILFTALFIVWHSRRMLHTYKDACGAWEIDKFRPLSEAFLNLFLNIILINTLGLDGVVISTILSMIIIGIPWEIKKFIKEFFKYSILEYLKFCLINLLKIIFIIICTLIINQLIVEINFINFVFKILLCAITCIPLTFVLYKNENALKRIKYIINKREGKIK